MTWSVGDTLCVLDNAPMVKYTESVTGHLRHVTVTLVVYSCVIFSTQVTTYMSSLCNSICASQSRLNLAHVHNSRYSNNFEHSIMMSWLQILVIFFQAPRIGTRSPAEVASCKLAIVIVAHCHGSISWAKDDEGERRSQMRMRMSTRRGSIK